MDMSGTQKLSNSHLHFMKFFYYHCNQSQQSDHHHIMIPLVGEGGVAFTHEQHSFIYIYFSLTLFCTVYSISFWHLSTRNNNLKEIILMRSGISNP